MSWNVIQQGKTSETQYSIASYDSLSDGSLSTVADAFLSSITTNPSIANSITVPNVSPSGGTTLGSGAMFTLTSTAGVNAITGITVTTPGSGYTIGTTIVFDIATLTVAGFTGPTTDLIITLVNLPNFQPSPTTSTLPYATTTAFNTEGDGQGVTISYNVSTATVADVKVVLDINNDPDVSDQLWVATDATHTSGTGTFFVASKNSYRQVRLRVESGTGMFSITNIKLMVDS